MFRVIDGSLRDREGYKVERLGAVIDTYGGLMKYGELDWLEDYFKEIVDTYIKAGFSQIAGELVLVEFDSYSNIISVEEICSLINYMIDCSGNGDRIMRIITSDETEIHKEIHKLKELGY